MLDSGTQPCAARSQLCLCYLSAAEHVYLTLPSGRKEWILPARLNLSFPLLAKKSPGV